MLLSCIIIRAQQIFSLSCTGNIIPDSSFIDSLYVDYTLLNTKPYILQDGIVVSDSQTNKYEIKLLEYNDWGEDPGDIHIIEIYCNGHNILGLENSLGWNFFYTKNAYTSGTRQMPVYIIEMKTSVALVLTGFLDPGDPPLLSIIVLENAQAKLVFNKPAYIEQINKGESSTLIRMQLNTVEYDSNNKPYNEAKMATLTFENGMIYYKE